MTRETPTGRYRCAHIHACDCLWPDDPVILRLPPEGAYVFGPVPEHTRLLAPGRYPHQYAVQPMGRKWGRR